MRSKNTAVLDEYIRENLRSDKERGTGTRIPAVPGIGSEKTALDRSDLIGEYMMLHLRLTEGFEEVDFERCFGESTAALFGDEIAKYTGLGLMEKKDGRIRLTEQGLDVANVIMADFI